MTTFKEGDKLSSDKFSRALNSKISDIPMKKSVLLIKKAKIYNFSKKDLNQYDFNFSENVWIAAFLEPLYFIF